MYRKPSHTDRYLQFSSHHPAHVEEEWPHAYFVEPEQSQQGDNVRLEEEHLRRVLKDNGFPAYIIDQAARQKKRVTPLEEKEENKYSLCLPYIAGIGEDLRRICKKIQDQDLLPYTLYPSTTVDQGEG